MTVGERACRDHFVVRFTKQHAWIVRTSLDDGWRRAAAASPLASLMTLEERFGPIEARPLFPSEVTAPTRMESSRPADSDYGLDRYLTVGTVGDVDRSLFANALRGLFAGESELVYYDPPGENPSATDTLPSAVPADPTDPLFREQSYLALWPSGIGAAAVWQRNGNGFAGSDGSGVSLADVEENWYLQHEDLPRNISWVTDHEPPPDHGDANHGTKTLGVLVAQENGLHCVGICPRVESIHLSSHLGYDCKKQVAPAILAAAEALKPPAVLLLEIHLTGLTAGKRKWTEMPVEVCDATWQVIRKATDSGIVVVECAGNGGHDLNDFRPGRDYRTLDPKQKSYQDSGAIMVGAGDWDTDLGGWKRDAAFNHGRRVNLFAHGSAICTLYWDSSANPSFASSHTLSFGGTSGAGAIVAGACASALGMSVAVKLSLTPEDLRAALVSTGNEPAADIERIGRMPDLVRFANP